MSKLAASSLSPSLLLGPRHAAEAAGSVRLDLTELPDEVILHVLSFLNPAELATATAVCRNLRRYEPCHGWCLIACASFFQQGQGRGGVGHWRLHFRPRDSLVSSTCMNPPMNGLSFPEWRLMTRFGDAMHDRPFPSAAESGRPARGRVSFATPRCTTASAESPRTTSRPLLSAAQASAKLVCCIASAARSGTTATTSPCTGRTLIGRDGKGGGDEMRCDGSAWCSRVPCSPPPLDSDSLSFQEI